MPKLENGRSGNLVGWSILESEPTSVVHALQLNVVGARRDSGHWFSYDSECYRGDDIQHVRFEFQARLRGC